MKRWILIVALALNTSNCGKSATENTNTTIQESSRKLASTESGSNNNPSSDKPSPLGVYPSSFISFLKNETQRVKLESTLKQYASIIPEATFTRIMAISKKVDDSGFVIKRKNGNLILDNGKTKFVVGFSGNLNSILTTIQGQTYDFNQETDTNTYLTLLESKIDNDLKNQKPKTSETKKDAQLNSSHSNGGLQANVFPEQITNQFSDYLMNSLARTFLLQCQLLSLPFMAKDSEAIATGWFIIGGMALIAVAIAIAANKMTKNLKKTEHTVNHKFGLSESSENVITDLTTAVKDADVDLLSNNNVNVTPDGVTVDKNNLGIE